MSRKKRSRLAGSRRKPKARPRGPTRAASPKRTPMPRWIGAIAVVAFAAIALAVGRAYVADSQVASVIEDDAQGEIVDSAPFRAIHEMRSGPRVPFLPADEPQPKIEVPTAEHDFGSISPKAVVTHTFLIRNVGAALLTISRAFTTCGCTTAEISARVIPPGKAAYVKLRFDAGFHDTRGKQVKRGLVIESNDRSNWKTTVWTRASIRRS